MDINIKNIDEELWQETRATAIRDRKTMRDVLSEALRMWLEARNTKRRDVD